MAGEKAGPSLRTIQTTEVDGGQLKVRKRTFNFSETAFSGSCLSAVTFTIVDRLNRSVRDPRRIGVQAGKLVLPEDMIRMAVYNRHGQNTPTRVAFLENWGTWRAAFATTVSHDSHNLTVFGRGPEDMAAAANAVRQMQGGLAVACKGRVIASLALPLAGLISEKPVRDVAAGFADLRAALDGLVDWQPPYLVSRHCLVRHWCATQAPG